MIGITAPASIHTSTPESLVSYAGKNVDTISQKHLQQTAGQRFNLNAGKGFTHDERFVMRWPFDDEAIRNRRVELTRRCGSRLQGKSDGEGRTNLQKRVFAETVSFKILPEE